MEHFSNSVGRIDFFHTDPHVVLSVYGQSENTELRELFVSALECVREHRLTGLVSDFSSVLPFSSEDVHWINWTWFPGMKGIGWTRWAIVPPASLLARAGLRDFTDNFRSLGVVSAQFSNLRAARSWLTAPQFCPLPE